MTIKDLKEKIEKLDENLIVCITAGDGFFELEEITVVEDVIYYDLYPIEKRGNILIIE